MPRLSSARATRATAQRPAAQRVAGLLAALACLTGAAAQYTGTPFDPRTDSRYGDARPALRTYLAQAVPRPRGPQHFCAIAYRLTGGTTVAWMHWVEGNALILWEPQERDEDGSDVSLVHARRDLDLNTDVMPTDADVASSTYMISRLWLDRTLADCRRHGARYTVTAGRRRREGGE